MPLRLVLDTNVVLDLLHYADPQTQLLAAMLAAGRAECFAEAAGLAELERVLAYPDLRLTTAAAGAIIDRYRGMVCRIDDRGDLPCAIPRCRDPDDQKFLELAVLVGADFLLSRDRQLLRLDRRIRNCAANLRIMTPQAWSRSLVPPEI